MRGLPAHLAMMLSISMNKQLILRPVFHSLKNTEIMGTRQARAADSCRAR